MFDIAWSKLMIIGVVALIVIGPKDLPGVLRSLGEMVGKLRRMADEFRGQFSDAMRESQFDDIKKDMSDLGDSVRSATSTGFNPIQSIRDEVKGAVEARNAAPAGQGAAAVAEVAAMDARLADEQEAKSKAADNKGMLALSSIPAPDMPPPLSLTGAMPDGDAKPAVKKRKVKAAKPGPDAA